jgi:peptidoglycan/xylan/chitin deacetylase (PgdA/CDA1 family)
MGKDGVVELVWPQPLESLEETPFDPAAAAYWLAYGWERQAGVVRDGHGRPIGSQSPLASLGILMEPLINLYAARLRESLGGGIDLITVHSAWPANKRFALVLTHDMDYPLRWTSNALGEILRGAIGRPTLTRLRRTTRDAVGWAKTCLIGQPDPHWNLHHWQTFEKGLGARSAVYAGAICRWEPGAAPNDVPYRLSHPVVAASLRQMDAAGWEIGLHPGYNAFRDAEAFRRQQERLERLLGHPVAGLRHHVLRLDPDGAENTLALQQQLGFRYDASVIFNDTCGFRRGVATPYHPAGPSVWPPLGLVELGHTIMDNQELRGPDIDKAIATMEQMTDRIAAVGGCVVLNWHVRSWNNSVLPRWREVAARLIARLAARTDVWMALPREVADWWHERSRRLRFA